jgi:hypothetical protein
MALLRQAGCIAAPVERWLPAANKRSDVWGFGDVLAAVEVRTLARGRRQRKDVRQRGLFD